MAVTAKPSGQCLVGPGVRSRQGAKLVEDRRREARRVDEGLDVRQGEEIGTRHIPRAVEPVADVGTGRRHERAGAFETFGKRLRYWYRRNIGFKAVDLADVEDGERAEHRPRSGRRRLVRLVFFAFRIETLHQNDRGAALATANLAASLVQIGRAHV